MGKIILTYNDAYEVNQIFEERGIKFRLHLHDMCGSQSFTIEPLEESAADGHYDEMKTVIEGYFNNKGIQIRFLENNLEFIIVS